MGYISKDIADITEPALVTLSDVPNFVQFSSKPAMKVFLEITVKVSITPSTPGDLTAITKLDILDPSGLKHTYTGTTEVGGVSGNVYYISTDTSDTAENLRQAILADKWLGSNFEVVIPFVWEGSTPKNGDTIYIKSKGAGEDYNIRISAPNDSTNAAYTITDVTYPSQNNDSISGEKSTAEIDLDLYTSPSVFLGEDDRPVTPALLGTYVTTLQKTYAGAPLWFELNSFFSQYQPYNLPPDTGGWFDTGTCRAYRFVAKLKSVNSFAFYQSNALYVLNGYGRISESPDLGDYIYNGNIIKLLTNKPRTNYVRGQKEYLNFILADAGHNVPDPVGYSLRVAYDAYTTSGVFLGTVYGQEQDRPDFAIVNTCVLDIDTVLDQYENAGIIRVALARGVDVVSNYLEYSIMPDCLHILRQFSFINKLGGWDAFNFDAEVKDDIKPSNETYNKTITPAYTRGSSVETVYSTALANTFTVEGAPVTDAVAEWLKEFAAARVVLDGEGNYIIIEDFTLSVTAANKNMQKPTIKYRYG